MSDAGNLLAATTNALVAFVVERFASEGKPTIAGYSASIVAHNAVPFTCPSYLTHLGEGHDGQVQCS